MLWLHMRVEVLQHWHNQYQAAAQVPAMLEVAFLTAARTSAQQQHNQQDTLQDSSAHHGKHAERDASLAHSPDSGLPSGLLHYQPGRAHYAALDPAFIPTYIYYAHQQQDSDNEQEQQQNHDQQQQQQQMRRRDSTSSCRR
jgi:hypothetical protein